MSNPQLPRLAAASTWDRRYDTDSYLYGTAPNVFLASQAYRLKPGMTALAVADGEGRNGVWLAERGLKVHAVDASEVAAHKSRKLASRRGVHLETEIADLTDWDWGRERFDLVAAIFIQFAPPSLRARLFEGIQQALRPGGLLVLQGYRPDQLGYGTGGPPQAEHLYTSTLLRAAFSRMQLLHLREHDSTIHEGEGHRGMSALIEMVAVKRDRA